MKKEITISEKKTYEHFSEIASEYRILRTTDLKPILHIKNQLNRKSRINIADVGCGDGRYSLKLLQYFGDRCYLYCVDSNDNMLIHLKNYLGENKMENFRIIKGDAEKLPLEDHSLDCIVTFNAIHHFDIQKFLGEAIRSLKDDGYLFIYTRLRNQNSRSIWGKYFPSFTEVENRLYELDKLKTHIQEAGMGINSIKVFVHHRSSSLGRLVEQAQNHHYSTFSLYSNDAFEESLEEFQKNIKSNFQDTDNIKWQDENILLEIRK